MANDSLKEKTISSLFWKFFERFGSSLASLVVQIVMARLLMPEDYGLLAIILVFVNLGDILVKSGLPSALVQTPEASEEDFSTVFWISFIVSLVLFAVIFFLAPLIAWLYQSQGIIWPLRAMGLLLVIGAFNGVQGARVTREMVFRKTFVATIVSVFVSGALGIALAFAGAGLWALVAQQLTYSAVYFFVLRAQVRWWPQLVFDGRRAKELFLFGWKLLAAGFISTAYSGLSNLIVGKQFSADMLGILSQGEKIPNALGKLTDGTIQPVMMSAVSHVQHDVTYVRRLMRRAIRTSAFVIYPVMGCLFVVADPLVRVLLGEQWLPCVPFLRLNCIIYAQLVIQANSLQTLIGTGKSSLYLLLDTANKALCFVVLVYTVFFLHDLMALVVGGVLASILTSIIDILPHRKMLGYTLLDLVKDTAPAAGFTLIAGAIAYAVTFADLVPCAVLMAEAIIMIAVYLVLAWLTHLEGFEYLLGILKNLFAKE